MHAGAIVNETDSTLLVHNGGASHDPGRRRVGIAGGGCPLSGGAGSLFWTDEAKAVAAESTVCPPCAADMRRAHR